MPIAEPGLRLSRVALVATATTAVWIAASKWWALPPGPGPGPLQGLGAAGVAVDGGRSTGQASRANGYEPVAGTGSPSPVQLLQHTTPRAAQPAVHPQVHPTTRPGSRSLFTSAAVLDRSERDPLFDPAPVQIGDPVASAAAGKAGAPPVPFYVYSGCVVRIGPRSDVLLHASSLLPTTVA